MTATIIALTASPPGERGPADLDATVVLGPDELTDLSEHVADELAAANKVTIRIRDEVAPDALPVLLDVVDKVLALTGHNAQARRSPFGYVDLTITRLELVP